MAKAIRRVALLLTFSLLILTSTVGVASSQAGNVKYDADGDRLIEVSNLEQLDAIRYDLDGDGSPDIGGDANKYGDAFPTSGTEKVCESACNGYELTRSLDFDNSVSYASGEVNTAWTTGAGWDPIGDRFEATFDGNGNTISNLHINRMDTHTVGLFSFIYGMIRNIGLVDVDVRGKSGGGLAGSNLGTISDSYASGNVSGSEYTTGGLVGTNGRSLGSVNVATISRSYAAANVSGRSVGGLVGSNHGSVNQSYATGTVSGTDDSGAGGLAGYNHGTINSGYATGNVSGGSPVGGLAGYNWRGTIISSYATGSVEARGTGTAGGLVGRSATVGNRIDEERDSWVISSYATGSVKGGVRVGGLIGHLLHPSLGQRGGDHPSKIGIVASYATGSVEGNIQVGGLIGAIHERSDADEAVTITASYATGSVQGNTSVGGLIGYRDNDAAGGTRVSSSYWDTQTSGQSAGVGDGDPTGVQGRTTTQLQAPTGYTGIYTNWNADLDNADGDDNSATETDDFWDFGTSSQYPALKADIDENGTPTWQEFGGQRGDVPTYTPPEAPTGLTAMEPEPTQITFSWTAPSDNGGAPITAYDLRHIETGAADKSDANWTVKEDVWTTGSGPLQYSLTGLTGLTGSTQYDVQVRGVNAAGESEWSATVTGTTAPPVAPEAPTGLTARVVSGEAQVVLSWTAPANTGGAPITGYKIEASDDGNTSWTEVHTTTGAGAGYTDLGDDGDGPMFGVEEVRHYRVSAVNSVGEGAPSNVAKAEDLVGRYDADGNGTIEKREVIQAIKDYLFGEGNEAISKGDVIRLIKLYLFGPSTPHNRPGAPEGLTAAGNGQTRIDLSWAAPSDDGGADITGYKIEVSPNGSSWSDLEGNTLSTSTSYSHSSLTAGSTRHYRVSAINSEGTGPASNVVTGTTDAGNAASNADTDRAALGALYNATNGANWHDKDNWQSGAPMGEWHGVTTDSDGRVTHLSLYNNQLTGEIPAELGNLTNLEGLQLRTNQLTGEIPAELGNLTNLELLTLYRNQLTGEIPAELGSLPNLKGLSLYRNQLTGEIPAELGDLTNLELLSLSSNQLTGEIPAELGNLTNLEGLQLHSNQLTGEIPVELGNLANLQTLYLFNNQLTGEIPAELGNLTNLEGLFLNNNQLTGEIPAELGSLPNLKGLSLYRNQLTGEIPAELGNLTNLEGLSLSSNQLTGEIPAELGNLTNLELLTLYRNQLSGCIPAGLRDVPDNDLDELGLADCASGDAASDRAALVALYNATGGANWGNNGNWLSNAPMGEWHRVTTDSDGRVTDLSLTSNQLTGAIPVELGDLTSLKRLSLSFNQLTGEIPAELGDLTNLTHLYLRINQLTGAIPAELGDLTNLTHLLLDGNQLTGEIPAELGSLPSLEVLWLQGNQLTGEIPAELGDLPSLEVLFLSSNQLTGEIPAELGDLTNLEELYLNNNQLTGEIPAELGDLTNLEGLALSFNQLTGEIPAELGDLTNLAQLHLSGNQLTGEIPAELGNLTNLEWLQLRSNQLTGEIPVELGNLANLQTLSLSGNQLTGAIPVELGNLTNLTELQLRSNQLTGAIPAELGSLPSLQSLWLQGNQLTGEIPAELGDLTNLEGLDLRTNQLTGKIPAELGDLTNLRRLYLSDNQLTGCIPEGLRNIRLNDFGQLGLPFCGS